MCPSIAEGSRRWRSTRSASATARTRLVFDARSGAGVVVRPTDLGDRFRLVANTVEVVPPDEPLRWNQAYYRLAPGLPGGG